MFAGKKSPVVFGEPEEWLALLIESLLVARHARAPSRSRDAARSARSKRRRRRPARSTASRSNGSPTPTCGSGRCCEAVINGRYYWVPFARLARIDLEAPADLRDVVWMPAHFQFANGGETVGVIPTRYPGLASAATMPLIRLAARRSGTRTSPEVFTGWDSGS